MVCSTGSGYRCVLSVLPLESERIRTVGNLPDLAQYQFGEIASKRRKRGKGRDDDNSDWRNKCDGKSWFPFRAI